MKRELKNEGGGRGRGRKEGNACRQTPRFWKPAFASECSAWLARLVEQFIDMCRSKVCFILRGHVWYVTRILISCGCCLLWSARFTLQCKSIFFNFFWNAKLFLRLYKGFRSFNLFSKVSPGSEKLKAIFFCQGMRWFPVMFCRAGPRSLGFFFARC